MKVVIVLNTAWNAYNFRGLLIRNLIQKGHEVTLISPHDEFVLKLEEWGVKHVNLPMQASGLNPLSDLQYFRKLTVTIKAEAPGIILSYTIKPNIYASLAAKKLKIPIICNVSGLGTTFLWKGWVKIVAKTLYRRAFKSAEFIFFQNPDDQELMTKTLRLNEQKTGLVPGSGVDLETFRPVEITEGPFTFLMISRLLIEKGVREYLTASKQVKSTFPDCKMQLVGGYDPTHKRSISAEDFEKINSGGFIEYLGEMEDIRGLIKNAHCVVLPSYREGTPRTLLEGASMGKPLISTDVPGCREVIEHEKNGYLCETKDAESLAIAMIKMLKLTEANRKSFGNSSRKIAEERFDESIVWDKYWNKISELVSG